MARIKYKATVRSWLAQHKDWNVYNLPTTLKSLTNMIFFSLTEQ